MVTRVLVKKTWRGSSPSSFVPGSGSDASVALTWQSQYEAEHGNVDDVAKVFGVRKLINFRFKMSFFRSKDMERIF